MLATTESDNSELCSILETNNARNAELDGNLAESRNSFTCRVPSFGSGCYLQPKRNGGTPTSSNCQQLELWCCTRLRIIAERHPTRPLLYYSRYYTRACRTWNIKFFLDYKEPLRNFKITWCRIALTWNAMFRFNRIENRISEVNLERRGFWRRP